MNVNDHLNMNMGYNASLNNQTNTQFQSGTFRNVYAVIGKTYYLLRGFPKFVTHLYFSIGYSLLSKSVQEYCR